MHERDHKILRMEQALFRENLLGYINTEQECHCLRGDVCPDEWRNPDDNCKPGYHWTCDGCRKDSTCELDRPNRECVKTHKQHKD